ESRGSGAPDRSRGQLKDQTALSVAYGAGLRASEVVALKVTDIDSQRMTLRIEQGKPAKIATRCYRRCCSSGCAVGGGWRGPKARCSTEVGCSPVRIQSSR